MGKSCLADRHSFQPRRHYAANFKKEKARTKSVSQDLGYVLTFCNNRTDLSVSTSLLSLCSISDIILNNITLSTAKSRLYVSRSKVSPKVVFIFVIPVIAPYNTTLTLPRSSVSRSTVLSAFKEWNLHPYNTWDQTMRFAYVTSLWVERKQTHSLYYVNQRHYQHRIWDSDLQTSLWMSA
jgi:hypothetical protein